MTTDSPVVPVMASVDALSEFSTLAGVHGFGLQQSNSVQVLVAHTTVLRSLLRLYPLPHDDMAVPLPSRLPHVGFASQQSTLMQVSELHVTERSSIK